MGRCTDGQPNLTHGHFNFRSSTLVQGDGLVRVSRCIVLTGIITALVLAMAIIPGCTSPPPGDTGTITMLTTEAIPAPPSPAMTTAPNNHPVAGSPEKLQITVNSATLSRTLPGFTNKAGTGISVINVSIKNNRDSDWSIARECLVIKTETDTTMEHGGGRVSPDMAGDYLRFPIKIGPGETKTGLIIYIVNTGSLKNDLLLKDGNNVVLARVDLNKIYTYA